MLHIANINALEAFVKKYLSRVCNKIKSKIFSPKMSDFISKTLLFLYPHKSELHKSKLLNVLIIKRKRYPKSYTPPQYQILILHTLILHSAHILVPPTA